MTRTLRLITALLTLQLFSRGLDYVSGNPHPGTGVFQVESLDPPVVWGAVCILAALANAIGLVRNHNRVIRDGAIVTASIYLIFALMVIDDINVRPLDDWRFFTGYLITAGIWSTIAYTLTIRMAVADSRKGSNG